MRTPSTENLVIDPETLAVMHARARQARSEFVNNAVLRLFAGIKERLGRLADFGHPTARLG